MARFNHADLLRKAYRPLGTGQFRLLNGVALIRAMLAVRGTPGIAEH